MDQDQESKWKSVFKLYETGSNTLTRDDFIAAVRVCGHCYTNTQLEEKLKMLGKDQKEYTYETFYGFLSDQYTGPTHIDLMKALQAFDVAETGELSEQQLRQLLTTMGDKMDKDDAEILLRAAREFCGSAETKKNFSINDFHKFLTPETPNFDPDGPELMKQLIKEEAAKAGLKQPTYTESSTVEETAMNPNEQEVENAGEIEEEEVNINIESPTAETEPPKDEDLILE